MRGCGPGRGTLPWVPLVLCLLPGPWVKLPSVFWESEAGFRGNGSVMGGRCSGNGPGCGTTGLALLCHAVNSLSLSLSIC